MGDFVGKVLCNQYFLRKLLGRGGMGEIYQAWDQQRNTYMAIKLLKPELANDSRFLDLFKREADHLTELQHPNIVRLYEFHNEDPRFLSSWIGSMALT